MGAEAPFFFSGYNKKLLFGICHEVTNKQFVKQNVIICCHPMFAEKLHSHRILVNFARFAMKEGFTVLRFDFRGMGESEGGLEENGVNTWLADIDAAVTWVNQEYSNPKIFLLGLRFGASLALLSLQNKKNNLAGCVLWEPIFNIKSYFYKLLRVNLSAQMVVNKKIIETREDLVDAIGQGKYVDIDGYLLGNPLWKEAHEIDLSLMTTSSCNYPILLYQISPSIRFSKEFYDFLEKNSCSNMIDICKTQQKKFWLPQVSVYPACKELFNGTIDWLKLLGAKES